MDEEELQPDNLESEEVLQQKVDDAEMTSEEEGFLMGYNEDMEPDKSDEEGLEEDERFED
ncbi:MAG: hypothetical protein ACMXYK_04385 [Candidatus Woesearchaeota archaeon]